MSVLNVFNISLDAGKSDVKHFLNAFTYGDWRAVCPFVFSACGKIPTGYPRRRALIP